MDWKFQLNNCLYGQEKIDQLLNKKLETVRKELQCQISKSLKKKIFKKHLTNHLFVYSVP